MVKTADLTSGLDCISNTLDLVSDNLYYMKFQCMNISECPFHHLITYVGDFVRDIKHHGTRICLRKLQVIFLANFQILLLFLPKFEDLKAILVTLDKLQCNELKNLISIEE